MPGIVRPKPIASEGVDAGDVATSTTQQIKILGQATAQGAGLTGATRVVTSATAISSTDLFVFGDTTSAGFTLTLPTVAEYSRNFWFIKRSSKPGPNTLTLAARGSDTINGGASISVTSMVIVHATSNTGWTATTIG